MIHSPILRFFIAQTPKTPFLDQEMQAIDSCFLQEMFPETVLQ